MKKSKLLYFALMTLVAITPTIGFCDTITSGVIGLTRISTGVVDTSKSYGDKLNENFVVVASSFNTLWTAVATDTGTLATRLNNVATDTSTLKTRLDNVATDTSTLKTRLDNVATDTATLRSEVNALHTATATLALTDSNTNYMDLGVSVQTKASSVTFAGTVTSTSGFAGTGTNLTALNASNLGSGTVPNPRIDYSSITAQGNAFNGATQLVQTNSNSFVPNTNLEPSSVSKLGASIESSEITDATIVAADVAASVFLSSSADSLTSFHIGAGAVGSSEIIDASIVAADVASSIFISSAVAAVNSFHLNTTGVGSNEFGSASVSPIIRVSADGRVLSLSSASIASGASTTSIRQGVILTTVGTTANQYYISADRVDVMSTMFINISTIVNLGVNGPGGLDTGAKANSTWYELRFITDGTTISVIASSASLTMIQSPTMPSGYTGWTRPFGAIFVDSSGNRVAIYKSGNFVEGWSSLGTVLSAVDPGTAYTDADISNIVSPRARHIRFSYIMRNSVSALVIINIKAANFVPTAGAFQDDEVLHTIRATASTTLDLAGDFYLPIFDSRTIKYRDSSVSSFWLYVVGYTEDY